MPVFFQNARDPISSYTHFLGAAFYGTIGIIMTVKAAFCSESLIGVISLAVFSLSLIALYSSSCIYHYIPANNKNYTKLRKLDHSMIFVLIAGTYTPIVIEYYPRISGLVFLAIIWTIALSGVFLKLFLINTPRKLSTLLYLLLGWALVFYFKPILSIPLPCFILLLAGGIAYSIGAVIYAFKKPNISNTFGFHELFHIFVLLGTLFHFICVFIFVA